VAISGSVSAFISVHQRPFIFLRFTPTAPSPS
jgi:hypothetical protein